MVGVRRFAHSSNCTVRPIEVALGVHRLHGGGCVPPAPVRRLREPATHRTVSQFPAVREGTARGTDLESYVAVYDAEA